MTFTERLNACKASKDAVEIYAAMIWATTGPAPTGLPAGESVSQLNALILARWSVSTFRVIKQKAWRIVDRRASEARKISPEGAGGDHVD